MRTTAFLLLLSLTSAASAQSPLGTYADAFIQRYGRTDPKVDYTVTVRDADRSAYFVEMTIANPPDPARLVIPAWAPGAYRLTNAGRDIADVTAADESGKALAVARADDNTWTVATGGARHLVVRYSAAVRNPREWARANNRWFLRETSGLVDGPRAFLYLDGWTLGPSHVTFRLPAGWEIATGLVATTDPAVYWAPSYDVLIDCPVLLGRFVTYRFTAGGVPHRAAVDVDGGTPGYDEAAFVDMLRRISEAAIALFGNAPYKDYTYIFTGRGGGLEHLNSTTIGIDLAAMGRDPWRHDGITAHEFYHTWNVKRIRPVELGPFDYTRPVRTLNLWISEGITDYYANLILVRSGIDSTPEFLDKVASSIAEHRGNPARLTISPERSSWTTWDGPEATGGRSISYYLQGELRGLMLDLAIRDSTDGRASLDDVMRALFDRYGGARGFTSEEALNTVNAVSGSDFHDFWQRYVSGTAEIGWNEFLAVVGWSLEETPVQRPDTRLGFMFPRSEGGTPRARITPGTAAEQAGVRTGDEVVAINGQAVSSLSDLRAAMTTLRALGAGDSLRLRLRRGGADLERAWAIPVYTDTLTRIADLPRVTERAHRLRAGLLTGR